MGYAASTKTTAKKKKTYSKKGTGKASSAGTMAPKLGGKTKSKKKMAY